MFEFLRNFWDFLGVDPFWPSTVAGLTVLYGLTQGLIPYEPVAKIKKTKDKDGQYCLKIYKKHK